MSQLKAIAAIAGFFSALGDRLSHIILNDQRNGFSKLILVFESYS